MITIAPTILTSDINEFNKQAETFNKIAKRVQIDIVDGDFAPVRTLALKDVNLPNGETLWDLHMMVSKPSSHLDQILRLKPNLCIFHAEIDEKLIPIFEELKKQGIKTGVALLKSTFPGNLTNIIKAVDHVLIFAGNLGQQGGEADLLQMEKVPILKKIRSDVEIGWDGGANLKTIRAIAHSGVSVINVGSAIAQASDVAVAFKELEEEAEKHGVRL